MTRGHGRPFWWGVGAGLAVLIVLAGWFAAISPQLSAARTAQEDTEGLQVQNQVQRTKISALAEVDEVSLRTSLQEAVAALPYDTALPALTRQLTAQAAQNRVHLDSIVIGAATAVGAAGAPDATGTSGAGAGVLLSIPVTLGTTGAGADQRGFLRAVQGSGPRRALVTSTQFSPKGGDDGTIAGRSSLTTSLTVFVVPRASAAEAQLEELLRDGSTG